MKLLTCSQCRQSIPNDSVHCPSCGAWQKLSPRQTVVWIARKTVIGVFLGVLAGATFMLLLSVGVALFGNLRHALAPTMGAMTFFGALYGGTIGALFRAVYAAYCLR